MHCAWNTWLTPKQSRINRLIKHEQRPTFAESIRARNIARHRITQNQHFSRHGLRHMSQPTKATFRENFRFAFKKIPPRAWRQRELLPASSSSLARSCFQRWGTVPAPKGHTGKALRQEQQAKQATRRFGHWPFPPHATVMGSCLICCQTARNIKCSAGN